MAERLTMKVLSGELDVLRKRLHDFEMGFERKLESAMEKAAEKLKERIEASEGTGLRGHGGAVDVDTRRRLIAETAYLRAERRGFIGGNSEEDWLIAEMEVDRLLLQGWGKNESPELKTRKARPEQESRA